MTRAELRELARFLLKEHGQCDVSDSGTGAAFGLNDALDLALNRYFYETRCSRVTYGAAAIPGLTQYSYSFFGSEPANSAKIAAVAVANNTTALTLIAGEPTGAITPLHYISVTISYTGGGDSGTAVKYTVTGTGFGGVPQTEEISFTASELQNKTSGFALTKRTVKPFYSVTSITPSAAQLASTWKHSAGVGAYSGGSRLFDIDYIEYGGEPVNPVTKDQLQKLRPRWRSQAKGTPIMWGNWADRTLFIHPAADSTKTIYAEGYELPDLGLFSAETDQPPILAVDHELLAIDAAILVIIRRGVSEEQLRGTQLYERRRSLMSEAVERIGAPAAGVVRQVGSMPGVASSYPGSLIQGRTIRPAI